MGDGLSGYLAIYGALVAVARPAIVAAILWGLWTGLSRLPIEAGTRLATWLAVALPLVAWLAAAWAIALSGAFQAGSGIPLLPLAIVIPLLVGFFVLGRAERIRAAIDAISPSWLIGLQAYRVLGGNFVVLWSFGAIPGVFALPAGIGDMAVGILALPAAFYLASGAGGGPAAARAWNLLGIADLVTAVTLGVLTAPGPLQLLSLDHPNVLAGAYPTVMTPAFAVPLSLILHGLSLRQLRRRAARDGLELATAQ
jgi:hypothetical protein